MKLNSDFEKIFWKTQLLSKAYRQRVKYNIAAMLDLKKLFNERLI